MSKRTTKSGAKRRAKMNPLKKLKSIQLKKNQKTDPTIISGGIVKPSLGRLNKQSALILALVFGGIGAYFIFFSKAATIYYVSSGGTGTTCSSTLPCGSIQTAWSKAAAGDTIYMKAGTYGPQIIEGNKTSETKIIGENGVVTGALSINAQNFSIENITVDVGAGHGSGGVNVSNTSNVTLRNVRLHGLYVSVFIDTVTNFNWLGGELGEAGKIGGKRICGQDPEPVELSNVNTATIDSVSFYRQDADLTPSSCSSNGTHLEMIRVDEGGSNFTLRNSMFENGDKANTSTVFITNPAGGSTYSKLKFENNFFGSAENVSISVHGNINNCVDWTFAYNTFNNTIGAPGDPNDGSCASSSGKASMAWIGNLGARPGWLECFGTHTKNVWQSINSYTCGSDTVVTGTEWQRDKLGLSSDGFHITSASPAKDAGESGGYCTSMLGARDHDGGVRPFGSACDAGAHEYGSAPISASTANLWVDTTGGNCTRQATAAAYSDNTACGSFDQAWDAASAGDIIRVKAGTYPRQDVNGNKTAETKIIGENGTKVAGAIADCKPEFGAAAVFCANANFMTLENVTLDALDNVNPSSGSQINASNVTYRNVNIHGAYVSISIVGPNFTWQKGSHGQDGIDGMPRRCDQLTGEPVWVYATNAVLDGIRFNPKKIQAGVAGPYCGTDNTPHLENIRTESGATNLTIKNSWFVAGSDAGSGHIFTSTGAPGLKLINNVFESVNGSYAIQANSTCDWTVAYNTFMQGMSLGCSSFTWVGNLGVNSPGCAGTHIKNVWQGTGSCGSDLFVSGNLGIGVGGHLISGSPAIDAAETDAASDFCTGTLGSIDFEGTTRPQGNACDAGADEFGSGGAVPPPDTTAPTVSLTAPGAGSTVSGSSVTVSANASDNIGVTLVDFYDGTTKIGSDSTSPYSISWDSTTAGNGSHSLNAKAYDAASNSTTSAAVSITVSNAAPVPGSGSVAAYNFEEGSGATAADSSGNNNTLTMPSTAWTAGGKNGKAASFNGTTTSYGQRADSASLDLGGAGTIETWFKPNSSGVWHSLIAKGSANDNNAHNYALEIDDASHAICIIGNGSANVAAISTTTLATGTFYHLACTWDGANLRLYINGSQTISTAQGITPAGNSSPLLVGLFGGNADPANGVIDDVRIYNKALTASEVSGDMNTPVTSGPADTTPPTLPATKTITTSNVTSNSVTLSWNAASDPSGVKYNVYRNNAVIATTTNTTFTDNATNSAPNAGPSPSTTYTYTIRAADNAGNVNVDTANYENKQATTLTPPPDSTPPTAFTVSLVSASTTQINISWAASSDPESGIKGYDVYRDGVKQNSSILSATTLSFGQTGSFTAGQTYVYIVKAINNSTSTDPTQTTRDSNNLSVLVPGPGSSITRYVSLSGNDANACTQSSPCRTINRAYQVATAGDTIEVAAGTNYGSQTIAFRSLPGSPVTVRPASGATITFTDLSVDTSNIVISGPNFNIRSMHIGNDGGSSTRRFDITLDNLNIDAQDTTNVDAMYIGNTQNLTLRNSKVGNTMAGPGSNDTAKSVMTCAGNSTCHNINMTFENNLFYDADAPSGSLAHLECIWAGGVQGFTLRKNTFRDCTFFDVFITVVVPNNQPQPKDHIFEDNLFGQTVHPDGYDFGYTINVHRDVQPNNFIFQRNTIEGAIATANGGGTIQAGGWKIIGNIIAGGVWLSEPEPQGCRNGIVFDYNVMPNTCGGNTTTATSTAIRGGWVAPVGPYGGVDDFHLKSSSPAINKGRPTDAGTLDFDGVTRANPPEAGAYEFVSATPPPPDAPPTTNITTPASGSTVSGSVDIFANTTDDKGLAKIEFYDNGTIMSACTKTFTSPLPTSTSTTCSWDTASASVSAGSHTLSTRAYDNVNPSVYSQNVTVTVLKTDTAPPNLPTDPTITTSNLTPTSVTLTWNASTDNTAVTCYEIYRYVTSQGANSANIIKNLDNDATNAACNTTTAFSGSTTYTDLTLIANTGYSYYIKAKDAASNASASYNTTAITTPAPPDTTPPSTPTNVTATAPSSSQVNLTWSPSSDNVSVAGYNIYLNGSSTPLNGSSLVTTTSYGHNGLASNTTYSYQVEAVDTAAPTPNKSPKSTAASVTTPAPPVQTLTFSPSADAWVSQQYPTRTYGTTSQLKGDSDPNQDILINFNVSGVGTKKVKSAKLRLYVNNGSDKGGDVLMLLSTNWNESSVNFNNAPAAETTPIASLGTVSKGTTIEVDVTSKVTIDGVYGFKLSIPSANNAIYNSKEASTNKPQLVLTLE